VLGEFSDNNTLSNVTASNNDDSGLIVASTNNTFSNVTASNNDIGIHLWLGTSGNTFTGELQVGTNTSSDCYVDNDVTDPGLVHETCVNQGTSDATLTTGIDLSSSFINDWALLETDTQIRNVLILPTGNNTLSHTWSDTTETIFLRNAVEIQDDDIGNDDALCESGEDCFFTPNIGRYQGHADLIDAGTIGTGTTLENINLREYETNGY